MEIWDAYTRDGELTGMTLVRGEPIPEGLYHMVCEVLVRHTDGTYLCMKRSLAKPNYPGFLEGTAGGSALKGESRDQCVRRELREETGIVWDEFEYLGEHIRDDDRCMFHTYFCTVDWPKDAVSLQEGETEGYVWMTEEEFISFINSGQMIPEQEVRFRPFFGKMGWLAPLKIALAAARLIDRDLSHNLARMERYMRQAKQAGARLVCFGETFLQGFSCFDWDYERDREMAVSTDSPVFRRICAMSRDIGIDVLFGFAEKEGKAIYSSAALIQGGGLYQCYRRISRGWKEYWHTDHHYREGETVPVFDYGGRRFSIALCGDLWDHPERFDLGEEVLLWPVYISFTPEEWEKGMKLEYAAQAIKCCPRTLLINSVCEGDAFGGAVYFENGEIRGELPMGEEGLLVVEV